MCLLLGGGFSLAVSSPDSGLGLIVVAALAFGGFASAALLWSRAIGKVLSKIGITTFAEQAMVTGALIICAIHGLESIGSVAARSSTPETQLRTSVSGTSAPPAPHQNNASDADKRAVSNSVSGASAGCRPPEFSQQELSALERQAATGDAAAQCALGYLYHQGQGVPQDYAQAAAWFRKAAEQGYTPAQGNLGVLYSNGEGVPQDDTQAVALYRMAAEQGDAHAQYNLGLSYEEWKGQGVPQNDKTQAAFWRRKISAWRAWINFADSYRWRYRGRYTQAAFWYRKAAEQGHDEAQKSLGDLYDEGQGVPQDDAQAVFWYRKAAEQGNADAQDELGDLYLSGKGVARDYAEAYFWFDLAAAGEQDASDEQNASDSKQVAKARDEAASHLTPADLFRAQERAAKWFEAHQAKPK